MTLEELIRQIEECEEDAIYWSEKYGMLNDNEGKTFHQGKIIAFRICLDKLREYRLSSGAE